MLSSEMKQLVLSSFKKGSTIDGISKMIHCEIKRNNKKYSQKTARTEVEQIILEDYLKALEHRKAV
jgi:hypothetical protein